MPASLNPVVPVIVPVRGEEPGVELKVRNAGTPDALMVSVFPASGSVAVAVIVGIAVPSSALTLAGAVSVGGVFPLEESAPSASVKSPVAQRLAGSASTYVFGKLK